MISDERLKFLIMTEKQSCESSFNKMATVRAEQYDFLRFRNGRLGWNFKFNQKKFAQIMGILVVLSTINDIILKKNFSVGRNEKIIGRRISKWIFCGEITVSKNMWLNTHIKKILEND